MRRIYGDEQRAAAERICSQLIEQLDVLYLNKFEELTEIGLGDGMVVKLTQLLLLSKEAAVDPLKKNNLNF